MIANVGAAYPKFGEISHPDVEKLQPGTQIRNETNGEDLVVYGNLGFIGINPDDGSFNYRFFAYPKGEFEPIEIQLEDRYVVAFSERTGNVDEDFSIIA